MAFDAGMVAASAAELRHTLTGGRIDKIYQPEKDEIVLVIRCGGGDYARLSVSAGSGNPHIGITAQQKENPMTAPQFCMLLRKHLSGAHILEVTQPGFERVIVLRMEARDEMGFSVERRLICEIMGKYSNIIFTDGDLRIIGAVRVVDFSTSQKRQVLPGMKYELPPSQDKKNPLDEDRDGFLAAFAAAVPEQRAEKFIMETYQGISPLIARETVFSLCARTDASVGELPGDGLWKAFSAVLSCIREERFTPVLITDEDGKPAEYSFMPIAQYGTEMHTETAASFGALIDRYFAARDHADRIKQRAADIFRLLANAETRLTRKIAQQKKELLACAEKDSYKKQGDLITANIWQLRRGMTEAELVDYETENLETVRVALDTRLTPSQNAQRYYKRYNKAKNAESALAEQIALAEEEFSYLKTVFDSLTHAETEGDLDEIRDELYHAGYASRMKAYTERKNRPVKPMEFRTSGGYRVLCGKNNHQNEYITHKLASKNDIWFHAKNTPGSHAVMFCADTLNADGIDAIPERDFTEAAVIAAYYSTAGDAKHVPVDYTFVRNLKKPPNAKPGMVIYHTNWSAYVTPDEKTVSALRVKK